jgi:hypothetical protein
MSAGLENVQGKLWCHKFDCLLLPVWLLRLGDVPHAPSLSFAV